jgi:coenzyme F420-reducing hydrogenase alpha subunit
LLDRYTAPEHSAVAVPPRAAAGAACTEAPRGMLYHRYRIDDEGCIVEAQIMPPTSQNQPSIEADLRLFVETHLDAPEDQLRFSCEQVVRNHDPCISCATHFLRLHIDRGDADS